ncbi:MAG: MFS transporter [Candidatus Bathyarchaeia archaeon]|nr:MFS transporter [Candidatus Bathyarchaeia archaeon]
MQKETKSKINKAAYLGILLLGIVSLMGDVVYEGSGGIIPDYLKFLGATGIIAGLIVGFGEFFGNAMRLLSGFLADTTRAYWVFIFLGYGLIVSLPLLGVSASLEIVIILVLLERLGKAIRSPSRDAVLSIVSKEVGAGKAFGIHEFLDQIGAILGPLLVATLMFSTKNNYSYTFSFLFIPFLILLVVLAYTYKKIGYKTTVETSKAAERKEKLPKFFYVYMLAVLVNTVGLMSAKLILFRASELLNPQGLQWIVPLMYLLIQGVDAPTALGAGYAYDKFGIKILVLPFTLSIFPALFAMSNNELPTLIAASVFSGLVLGTQESIYRAAVSQLTPVASRGTAYGLFNVVYGFGELVSGGIFGLFIDLQMSLVAVMFYAVAFQLVAIALLLKVKRE